MTLITEDKTREPQEVEICQLSISAVELLARDMDKTFQELIRRGAITPLSPRFEAAEAANRIVVLSRALVEEIGRYECTRWGSVSDDIPF